MTADEAFAILERCAANGERCPQNFPAGTFPSRLTSALAAAGKIRIEVFQPNWRVVTILVGPHKGKQTAPAQEGRKPYMVIDAGGTRRNNRAPQFGRRRAAPVTLRKFPWEEP